MLSQVLDENARKPLYISFLAFSLCSDMMVLAASVCASAVFLLQGQPDQSICLISHEQRNVQHVIIQFQIIQGEADPQLDLVRKQFFEFFEALAGNIGFGFDFHRENIVFTLDQKIYFIRRICLCPVSGSTSNCVIKV